MMTKIVLVGAGSLQFGTSMLGDLFQSQVITSADIVLIGLTKGGMNTKLHAVTDTSGRPVRLFITAGQVSAYTGAAALMNGLPEAEWLLADRGYDADWFRETLIDRGTKPCIPGRKSRKKTVKYDKRRYKRRNRIERMFGRLKDWRRVATRYDRSPTVFISAIALAATLIC